MVRRIKMVIATLVLACGIAPLAVAGVSADGASGEAKNAVCSGINSAGGNCSSSANGLTTVIQLIINIISVIAGIAAVIMIMVAGLRYITSGGDASKVAGAKSAIVYAIVGLLVVAFAQLIVRYVAKQAI
jgi:Type IV secretion system pilin